MPDKSSKSITKSDKAAARQAAKESKERLSRITKTRSHHIRTTNRIFKYGTKSFVRNTWLSIAAVAIMTITLLVLSATLIATHVMRTAIAEIEDQVDMSIYIKQTSTRDQINNIIVRLRELDSVTSATATSPDEANHQAIQGIIENHGIEDDAFIQSLYEAPNKLPWTINVKLRDLNDTSELERFVENDSSMRGMLDAKAPSYADGHREAIDYIANAMNKIEVIGLGAAAVFALIAILVIFNTIRMAIFNRKEEIYMMRLVGASRSFIVGPFVVEASLYGVIAAILAGSLIYILMFLLGPRLGEIVAPTLDLMSKYWYFAAASLLIAGVFLGIISSLLATRKYLKIK